MGGCFFAVTVVIVAMVVATVRMHLRLRRIAAVRRHAGENFETFCSELAADSVPDEISFAVYTTFQELCGRVADDFPVRASDGIYEIYGIIDEDVDDAVMDALAKCGRRFPSEGTLDHSVTLNTVRDVALFIATCPKLPTSSPILVRVTAAGE